MIQKIKVINHLNASIELSMTDHSATGLAITSITGLDPGKANVSTSAIASSDGSLFNSARLGERNIVINFRIMDCPTAEDTRQRAYYYFPIKRSLTLLFYTDKRECYINGYVETINATTFGANPTIQVSIICPQPYFYSTSRILTVFSGVDDEFEFPLELSSEGFEFGSIRNYSINNVYYSGDMETGFVMSIETFGTVVNPMIYNSNTGERMVIDTTKLETITGKGLVKGDKITISTVKGDKYLTLLREGNTYNILNCLDKNVSWFEIYTGDNVFGYTAESGAEFMRFQIRNNVLYEGI